MEILKYRVNTCLPFAAGVAIVVRRAIHEGKSTLHAPCIVYNVILNPRLDVHQEISI